jgi:hypothetical protein
MANAFDAANAPEGIPETIVVGDFIQWKRSDLVTDYPVSSYSAKYIFRKKDGSSEFQVTSSGSSPAGYFLFNATNSSTYEYEAGVYFWQLEIIRSSDSERIVLSRGEIEVVPDLDVSGTDNRSHNEVMLSKIQSLLEGKADSDVSSYSIAGRSLTKLGFQELVDAKNYYKSEVLREKRLLDAKNGRSGASTVKVRF